MPFRDQVVHHALMAVLEPVFGRRMIPDSYACRTGKGQHAALARAREFVRRYGWFLKMDVRSFFPSVRHDVMRETLARIVKDRRVLALCDRILRGPLDEPPSGRGLPIGSLTSQWFANLLLDRLDHHVKEEMRVPGYLRYMDDFVLFDDSRAHLHEAAAGRRRLPRLSGVGGGIPASGQAWRGSSLGRFADRCAGLAVPRFSARRRGLPARRLSPLRCTPARVPTAGRSTTATRGRRAPRGGGTRHSARRYSDILSTSSSTFRPVPMPAARRREGPGDTVLDVS